MALYSSNQLSLRDSFHQEPPIKRITTKSGKRPADITVSRRGGLIYTDYKNRTVNIVKNENVKELIELKNWRPQGVCSTFSGDLLITMERDDDKQSQVFRYSGSTMKQSIQFDNEGNRLYSSDGSHKYVCENNNLDICVADTGGQAVVVVNHEGILRFRYTM
ncbi:uncharacterized protein LOC134277029 [Saccostrea cucullata]|uniref:uncharacterized protein LOC134277029 n=1 Tax=Saccostrea cuccullata TaxID=36930 RepID=UPI002ED1E6A3